jgi:hypothetical protein
MAVRGFGPALSRPEFDGTPLVYPRKVLPIKVKKASTLAIYGRVALLFTV